MYTGLDWSCCETSLTQSPIMTFPTIPLSKETVQVHSLSVCARTDSTETEWGPSPDALDDDHFGLNNPTHAGHVVGYSPFPARAYQALDPR